MRTLEIRRHALTKKGAHRGQRAGAFAPRAEDDVQLRDYLLYLCIAALSRPALAALLLRPSDPRPGGVGRDPVVHRQQPDAMGAG